MLRYFQFRKTDSNKSLYLFTVIDFWSRFDRFDFVADEWEEQFSKLSCVVGVELNSDDGEIKLMWFMLSKSILKEPVY